METALFAIAIASNLFMLFALRGFWKETKAVKVIISHMHQEGKHLSDLMDKSCTEIEETLSYAEQVHEVLTEASRIKALREAGKVPEPDSRAAARQKRFKGIAERRAAAEKASLGDVSHRQQVHNNDIRALEGK